MDDTKTTGAGTRAESRPQPEQRGAGRKRRWEMTSGDVRFFLPKPGASVDRPELGRETTNEGEALVESFKTGQPFFTVVAWKATHEFDGEETKIVKQVVTRAALPLPRS